jgi:antagonist of KipI
MLEILDASGLATIQDSGRTGWRKFGVPSSGPMDWFAFQAANLLVGNSLDAAMIEIGAGEIELIAMQDCVIAATGAGYSLSVYIWDFPLWDSCFVRAGWKIRLKKSGAGMWGYLSAAGGFDLPKILGSSSTYLRGKFGGLDGRLLQAGDVLQVGKSSRPLMELPARSLAEDARIHYSENPMVEVILGPQKNRFDEKNMQMFLNETYKVGFSSDRMGYRLEGARLNHIGGADITSEGMTMGAIQIPADGQPIVMMADCATAGGYPKIASVISADLPLLAQCAPGGDSIRFRETTVEAAQEKYRAMMRKMKNGIVYS